VEGPVWAFNKPMYGIGSLSTNNIAHRIDRLNQSVCGFALLAAYPDEIGRLPTRHCFGSDTDNLAVASYHIGRIVAYLVKTVDSVEYL
jgi:hypothetical protein